MCGRFSFAVSREKLKKQFSVLVPATLEPRYNCAPGDEQWAILANGQALEPLRWGLIPHWANSRSVGNNLINARAEDIAGKPSFRLPIRKRRCLVPADSFYEWRHKQPYRILFHDNHLLALAGVWDEWTGPDGDPVRSFALVTTAPNREMAEIHNRMPVVIEGPELQKRWLSDDLPLPEVLEMLKPLPDGALRTYTVSPLLNSPRYEGEDLHKPYTPPPGLF
jgi:putative SOS response-associated peptidase YedK